ncbi:CASP-like protein 4A3 [Tripterygium wilfordii]|uniref:CASP-like protein 4A3 n=1 Tax=Tripterygium wilfordii TaxID=458696 RepID=UPI0018F848A1|nr:CASP-like protein 4A3 [Tripterygium wilfordii]XP_038687127.1 CASP-like protein 4A3 [Tripterygium wilfordii]
MEPKTRLQNHNNMKRSFSSNSEPKTRLQDHNNMKRSFSSNSESQSHLDSPLRFHSPLRSDQGDPTDTSPYASPIASPEKPPPGDSKAIFTVNKYTQFSPHPSPFQPPDNTAAAAMEKAQPKSQPPTVLNGALKEDGPGTVTRVGHAVGEGRFGTMGSVARTSRREEMMLKMAELGFRISEVVLCLISFSVMAADKTQGWSGDSFDRYKEYRYSLSMNVIGFAYSGFQAFDLAYNLASGEHVLRHHLRRQFNFFMDQVLAYLLISSSSSAATRVDDWQSNWGKDDFTEMASASVAMAFLAFLAFALSSLISGYNLFTA